MANEKADILFAVLRGHCSVPPIMEEYILPRRGCNQSWIEAESGRLFLKAAEQ